MGEVLAVTERPRKFDDLIGQEQLIKSVRKRISGGRIPKAWLFAGPSGGGKTTIARIIAICLQQEKYDKDFGNPPPYLIKTASSLDITEIDAALHNKVDDIESIIETSRYHPNSGNRYKIFIFDESHRITSQAQQLLLKPTEDAPSRAIWMFCTTEPGKINLTLKRRCAEYRVTALKPDGIRQLLKSVGSKHKIPGSKLKEFYSAACNTQEVTTPGMVLKGLEKYLSDGDVKSAFMPDGFDGDMFAVVQAMAKGNWNGVKKELGDGKLDGEQARKLRAIAGGYLRSMLIKSSAGSRALTISQAIEDFSETARTYDESMLTFHVLAALYKATHRLSK